MKTAVIVKGEVSQVTLTPETEAERAILSLFKRRNSEVDLSIVEGRVGLGGSIYGTSINQCQGGWLKEFEDEHSVNIVVGPKRDKNQE